MNMDKLESIFEGTVVYLLAASLSVSVGMCTREELKIRKMHKDPSYQQIVSVYKSNKSKLYEKKTYFLKNIDMENDSLDNAI